MFNKQIPYLYIIVSLTGWLTFAYAQPLISALETYNTPLFTQGLFFVFIFTFYGVTLSLARLFNLLKPVSIFLILVAAPVFFYMEKYGIVIDADMIVNSIETDIGEARDQISSQLIIATFLLGVLPAAILFVTKVQPSPFLLRAKQAVLGIVVFSFIGGSTAFFHYDNFASLFRNHRDVKYRVIPFNVVSAGISVLKQKLKAPSPFLALGLDATKIPTAKPKVMIVILGETARADHFSVNGYHRNTTPHLDVLANQGKITSYTNGLSCGTATAISVPCMFSFMNSDNYDESARNSSNVLDVLNYVGVETLWVENNSGCKNVCDRIPTITLNNGECSTDGCQDTMMVAALQKALLSATEKDKIIVLHQMGSHGPAYFKRSPTDKKIFLPECETIELDQCKTAEIINAYDNSLRITDQLIYETIEAAEKVNGAEIAVMYISDHGESLGEAGIYLHGLPNWIAPVSQRHIPWVVWPRNTFKNTQNFDKNALSHDYLSHTLLGYFDVKTSLYKPELDININH